MPEATKGESTWKTQRWAAVSLAWLHSGHARRVTQHQHGPPSESPARNGGEEEQNDAKLLPGKYLLKSFHNFHRFILVLPTRFLPGAFCLEFFMNYGWAVKFLVVSCENIHNINGWLKWYGEESCSDVQTEIRWFCHRHTHPKLFPRCITSATKSSAPEKF